MLMPGWFLVALLAWGVLSFGAVYPWAYWPLFAGAAGLGVIGVFGDQAWRDPRLKRMSLVLAVLALAIFVQLIALPAWLVARVSPGLDGFFREFLVGYHPATLQTLSLDPDATLVVLAEVAAFSLLFVGVARLLRRWPLDWLVSQIMALAIAVALVGIVQKAVLGGPEVLIYGFWRPRHGGNPFGPFVNRNHFAGWMVMVAPLVAAYAWALVQQATTDDRRDSSGWLRWMGTVAGNRVLLVLSCVFIMMVAIVMTGSRSGIAACAVAMAVLLLFMWRAVRGTTRWIATILVAFVVCGSIVWAGADTVASRFAQTGQHAHGRLDAWRDTWQIVKDFPLAGTGLGGYRSAMLVYQTGERRALYAQAHNEYLQILAEGGVLVSIPVACVITVLIVGVRRRLQSGDSNGMTFWIRRGAVAGLLGVAAQSIVEFSLQMPGNAAMFVTLAAMALHRPRSYSSHAHRV